MPAEGSARTRRPTPRPPFRRLPGLCSRHRQEDPDTRRRKGDFGTGTITGPGCRSRGCGSAWQPRYRPESGSETSGSMSPSIRFSVNSERSRLPKSMLSISATVPQAMSDAPSGSAYSPTLAFEGELVERGLDHRHAGRQLFEVDEPEAGVTGRRQEHRRRPAGAVGGVAPGNAAQVHGVEQKRPDVDIFAAAVRRDPAARSSILPSRAGPIP